MCWSIEENVPDIYWDTIICWSLDQENRPAAARIADYPSSFYFEFDDGQVSVDTAQLFHERLEAALGANGAKLLPFRNEDLSWKTKLYYGRPAQLLKLSFKTKDAARHAKNILRKGLTQGESYYSERTHGKCHETEQEVTTIRKLISERGLQFCGWFTCSATVVPAIEKITTNKFEYHVNYRTMKPYLIEAIPRPLWMDFDLEVYSHNHNQFPRHWNSKDVIHTASMVFRRDGETQDSWQKFVITSYPYIMEEQDMRTVTVIEVKNEEALLLEYAKLLVKMDPDLISGYNIVQFDNKYMDARITRQSEWPVLGRLKDKAGNAHNMSWSSSAYKQKDLYIPYTPGRQYLDMYEQLARTKQWPSYSLEYAAKEMFPNDPSKRKQDVKPKVQFEIYKAVCDARRAGLITEYLKTEKNKPGSGRADVKKILTDAGMLIRYCVYDSMIVGHIANLIFFWVGIREMCNIAGVQPEGLLTRGQQYKVCSMLYDACYKRGIVLDKRPPEQAKQFFYKGGLVQQPVLGLSKKVMTVDFQSLYPNEMIANELCYTTLIHPDDWHKYTPGQYTSAPIEISDVPEEDEDDFSNKPKKSAKKMKEQAVYYIHEQRFLKREVREGVLPEILRKLLADRKKVREIKTDDPEKKIVYNERQLALKISANSVYGFTGVRKGPKFQCLEITAATCHFGRESITSTIEWMIAKYNLRLIYGDTDSCMMQKVGGFSGYDECYRIAAEASEAQAPLVLEMEGMYDLYCVKQKMYSKATYKNRNKDKSPGDLICEENGDLKLEIKGMAPVRRDNCKWVQDTIYTSILMMMEGKSYYTVTHYNLERVTALYLDEVPLSQFVITKGLSSGYKNDNAPMKVFSEEMAKLGLTLEAGQRHEYVIIVIPGVKKVAPRMLLLSQFDPKVHQLDYDHYFHNLTKNKLDTVLHAEFHKWPETKQLTLAVSQKKVLTGEMPIGLIARFKKERCSLESLDSCFLKIDAAIAKNKQKAELAAKPVKRVMVMDSPPRSRRASPKK